MIPRNMKFQVNLPDGNAKGTITELKGEVAFTVPHRGVIGANGLANLEYFQTPVPYVDSENAKKSHTILCKMQHTLHSAKMEHSPFDVVAWKGNYAPYRFNLRDFVPVVAGDRDHLDPSVHCVLAVGAQNGENLIEFVTFNPRVCVSNEGQLTYRPPFFHRSGKSEFMTYLGGYDAR